MAARYSSHVRADGRGAVRCSDYRERHITSLCLKEGRFGVLKEDKDGLDCQRVQVPSGGCSRHDRERSAQPPLFTCCRHPRAIGWAIHCLLSVRSTLISSPPSYDHHRTASPPTSASACQDLAARPSIQSLTAGGSSPRIDGPV